MPYLFQQGIGFCQLSGKAQIVISSQSFLVHPFQNGNLSIGVIVDADCSLSFPLPHEATHILYYTSSEGYRKDKKKRVNLRTVKPLTKVVARSYDKEIIF